MPRPLSLLGAPSSAGAYAPGQEKAPEAFRRHGIVDALRNAGRSVSDLGDTPQFRWRPDLARPKAMNVSAVAETARAVAERASPAFSAGDAVLVLGGDCTVELGTVAGALSASLRVGLIYLDFDADLNPPALSDGALDWTGVAHLLDLPGAESELARLGPRTPMLDASDLLYFSVENVTANEARTIAERDIAMIGMAEVKADPAAAARRAVAWASRFEALLIHLDVDVLDFTRFPIAENTRRCDGLTLEELATALKPLVTAPNWRALTLTEVNPEHPPDEAAAFRELIRVLASSFH